MTNTERDAAQEKREPGATSPAAAASQAGALIEARTLMGGAREVVIAHAGQHYRLRITASDKLILTK